MVPVCRSGIQTVYSCACYTQALARDSKGNRGPLLEFGPSVHLILTFSPGLSTELRVLDVGNLPLLAVDVTVASAVYSMSPRAIDQTPSG
jgi:hypothetical protein